MLKEKRLREFTIEIADIALSFLFDRSFPEFQLESKNYDFIREKRAQVKFRVCHESFPEKRKGERIFDSGSTWSLYRSRGKYFLQNGSVESGLLPEKLVILESAFKSGQIYIKKNGSQSNLFPDPLGYPLNQVLMIILLSRSKGIMLHACGIDDCGHGYLFLGNSTCGKSTIARLWFENRSLVLNDDRIIIREKDGELWMYGTPWHGDFKEVSSKGLPIQKIFFLQHGKKNSADPKIGGEAVSMLLTRSFPSLWDKKGMEDTLGLAQLIVNKIPCYELNFLPDKRIIHFVRNINE